MFPSKEHLNKASPENVSLLNDPGFAASKTSKFRRKCLKRLTTVSQTKVIRSDLMLCTRP